MGGQMPYKRVVGRNLLGGDYIGDPGRFRGEDVIPMAAVRDESFALGVEHARRNLAGDLRRLEKDSVELRGHIVNNVCSVTGLDASTVVKVLDAFFRVP